MNYTVIPISTVNCFNCASNCGSYPNSNSFLEKEENKTLNPSLNCYPGPWYEIHHAAFVEGNPDTICFGIFYLFRQNHSFLQWNYTFWFVFSFLFNLFSNFILIFFSMPEITSPMVIFEANWSGRLHGDNSENIVHENFEPLLMDGKRPNVNTDDKTFVQHETFSSSEKSDNTQNKFPKKNIKNKQS